jgi:hypothetical protein
MSYSNILIPQTSAIIPVDTRLNNLKVLMLPTVSTNSGRYLLFKDYYGTSSNSSFTISTTGTDLIDDYNFKYTFSNAWGSMAFVADGLRSWRTMDLYNGALTPIGGGWSPLQIPGLLVWTDASTLNLANNTVLSTWTNGGTQGTVTCTGTFLTGQLNGLGIVRITTSQFWGPATQPSLSAYSMFFVSRQRGGVNARVFQSASGNYLYAYWSGQKNVLYVEGNPSILSGQPSNTSWDLFSHTRTQNASYTFNYNGTSTSSGASSLNGPLPGLAVNPLTASFPEQSDCDIAEVILYNAQLTTPQVQTVEGYLAWKWGLQANLPANHPYKNGPP